MSLKPHKPTEGDPRSWYPGLLTWPENEAEYKRQQARYEADPASFQGQHGAALSYIIGGKQYTAPRGMSLGAIHKAVEKHNFERFQSEPFKPGLHHD